MLMRRAQVQFSRLPELPPCIARVKVSLKLLYLTPTLHVPGDLPALR